MGSQMGKFEMDGRPGGHLDVRVRGGGMFYALWEPEGAGELRKSRV